MKNSADNFGVFPPACWNWTTATANKSSTAHASASATAPSALKVPMSAVPSALECPNQAAVTTIALASTVDRHEGSFAEFERTRTASSHAAPTASTKHSDNKMGADGPSL